MRRFKLPSRRCLGDNLMPCFKTIVAASALAFYSSPSTAADPMVKLYCAAGVVQVDERSWAEMKKALAPDVCTFGEFATKAAA